MVCDMDLDNTITALVLYLQLRTCVLTTLLCVGPET